MHVIIRDASGEIFVGGGGGGIFPRLEAWMGQGFVGVSESEGQTVLYVIGEIGKMVGWEG